MLKGIPVSSGISIAPVVILAHAAPSAPAQTAPADTSKELELLARSVEQAREQLEKLREQTEEQLGAEKAAILSAHMAFLEDPAFVGEMSSLIENKQLAATAAVQQVS
ncbi:phosphoenolpyruvate--protein phosphotransferase, partial [Mesorhizobium sp. M00.F.Ca.ET.186.01.1.1]